VAEQPRIHDSTSDQSARSQRPPPPLSRYARAETPPAEPAEADQPVDETGASAQPATDATRRAEATPAPQPVDAEQIVPAAAEPGAGDPASPPVAEPELVESLPPELSAQSGDLDQPQAALVTVSSPPAEAGRREKVPFWKRIVLPRPIAQATQAATGRSQSLEPILARIGALEKQLAANQSATEIHLDRFEENITRLWELEEQMTITEVRERLALLEANQEEIADGLHVIGRNVSILAIVLAIAVAATLLVAGLAG